MSITATPVDPLVQRLQSIAQLIASGNLPHAAKQLNAAVKASPDDPRVYLQGSRLAEAAGNPAGALESARRAVSLNPGWHVAVTELALLLARMNQLGEAVEQAEKAVALAPLDLNVLSRAVDIAQRAQRFPLVLQWLRQVDQVMEGSASVKRRIARTLWLMGDNAQSVAAYTELLNMNSQDTEALLGRVQSALAVGDTALALQDSAALVALDSTNAVYLFWHDVAQGKTPPSLPADLVRALHDEPAAFYDLHMVGTLGYQLPRQMAQLVLDRYPERQLNLLDLGCGTGLLGVALGKLQGALIGVDLSEKMTEQAARHRLYDRFHHVNLLDALAATPDALYHVIAACDAFSYVGDLSQAIPNAFRVLRPDGQLIFSCEAASPGEADFTLRPVLRYAHQQSHMEALCHAAGFHGVTVTPTTLFTLGQVPVAGYIVVAHKPA